MSVTMKSKLPPKSEIALIVLLFPFFGLLFGAVYSWPVMRFTKEREPWLTLLLGLSLGVTVFGLGHFTDASLRLLGLVWLVSIVLLLLVRAAFGLRGNLEHFGFVHIATLFLLFFVLVFTHVKNRSKASKVEVSNPSLSLPHAIRPSAPPPLRHEQAPDG